MYVEGRSSVEAAESSFPHLSERGRRSAHRDEHDELRPEDVAAGAARIAKVDSGGTA